jgi:hypothetical protein
MLVVSSATPESSRLGQSASPYMYCILGASRERPYAQNAPMEESLARSMGRVIEQDSTYVWGTSRALLRKKGLKVNRKALF